MSPFHIYVAGNILEITYVIRKSALTRIPFLFLWRFDIYRKVPKDLTQPTVTGAVISIICVTFMLLLLFLEFFHYLSGELWVYIYFTYIKIAVFPRLGMAVDFRFSQLLNVMCLVPICTWWKTEKYKKAVDFHISRDYSLLQVKHWY